jgi:SAM-dependent methyltransferase
MRTPSGSAAERIYRALPSRRPMTIWLDRSMFELMTRLPSGSTVLNVGSGIGAFDRYIPRGLKLINLDIEPSARTQVVADAHSIPFPDDSIDAIFSNAVLEHVRKPWVVADEMWRVLKPGGMVFIAVPFLNVIHDEEDYYRFTDRGLRVLFERFEEVKAGVSAGPSSFFGPFLIEYALCFVPTRPLRIIARQLLAIVTWPLKYLDLLVKRNPRLRLTADGFYFVGVKAKT